MITHSWPDTRPMPVTMPAPGTKSSYTSQAASWENSRKGAPGSSSTCTRSRGSSLPRATWRSRDFSPPPCLISSTLSRRSASSSCMWRRFSWKSSLRSLRFDWMTGMGSGFPLQVFGLQDSGEGSALEAVVGRVVALGALDLAAQRGAQAQRAAAIDFHRGAIDVACALREQEAHRRAHLGFGADAVERH